MHKKRVVVDTNCWISFLIGKRLASLVDLLSNDKIDIVLCEELLAEIVEVTSRPKFSKYFPAKEVGLLISFLREKGIIMEPTSDVDICRDVADNYLLALAEASKAHYLITGDKDLLVIEKYGRCRIVDEKTFAQEFECEE